MADSTPSKASPDKAAGAESPTTARPLDFDDDQQETGIISKNDGAETPTRRAPSQQRQVRFDEDAPAPPAKPPRPENTTAQKEATLIEAFPSVDPKVIKAVLVASNGNVEPAFHALLSMSDPNYVAEEAPPPQPPRPNAEQRQLQEDEMYARQLAQHYEAQAHGFGPRGSSLPQTQREGPEDREYSFFDDELPEIRKNIRQGFLQTQSTVNKWLSDFKKRIDGDEDENPAERPEPPRKDFGPSQSAQIRGIREMSKTQGQAASRRSTDHERYDADPHVISDNFTELELRDDEAPPPKPSRPLANPNLFKPTPAVPPQPPQSGPVDEVDALYRQPTPSGDIKQGAAKDNKDNASKKKWQPLTSVAPQAEGDDEHDPFSLGDSDDEETKKERQRQKDTDLREEDTLRLKKLASEKEGETPEERRKSLVEGETTASGRNKEAEDLLTK